VPHIFGKLLTRATIFLQISVQSEVLKNVMSFQSHKSPNFEKFGTLNLGVPGQNDIWVQATWPKTKNTIRGKVMAFPKLGPW